MIRPPSVDEVRFVRSSWLKNYASSDWARLVTPRDVWAKVGEGGAEYYQGHRALILRILETPTVRVLVDHEIDSALVDGWICVDTAVPCLHYVYVRWTARGRGVARRLVESSGLETSRVICTHRSRPVMAARVPKGWKFDPYPLLAYAGARKVA